MKNRLSPTSLPYSRSGYLLGLLLFLAILGFWKSYFSKLFEVSESFNGYFHFHAIMAISWLITLIVQPALIRKKQWELHRKIGTIAHFILGLFFVSAILLTHHQQSNDFHYVGVLIPFRDLTMISIAYLIAMIYRHTPNIHARGMIATGIAFIEPALVRALGFMFPALSHTYHWTIGLIYLTIIVLILGGIKHPKGQWVFPMILGLNMVFHSIILFEIPVPLFERFAEWFVGLPLT